MNGHGDRRLGRAQAYRGSVGQWAGLAFQFGLDCWIGLARKTLDEHGAGSLARQILRDHGHGGRCRIVGVANEQPCSSAAQSDKRDD
ncbi:unannotated protein [freshwater metagenome]|uniref:Unannotated protein n=1 Tax=freshwater metagenome TaxID=449393 RepID=A0A6J6TZH8_9ZZZZ